MTRAPRTTIRPRFRLVHKIAAWYDAEAYFRRRAKSGKAFAMPIPGFGDVLFAAKPVHIREFLKIPASAFTPPCLTRSSRSSATDRSFCSTARATRMSVRVFCPRCTVTGSGATPG